MDVKLIPPEKVSYRGHKTNTKTLTIPEEPQTIKKSKSKKTRREEKRLHDLKIAADMNGITESCSLREEDVLPRHVIVVPKESREIDMQNLIADLQLVGKKKDRKTEE